MYEKYERKQLCDCVDQLWVVLDLLIPMLENKLLGKHFYTKNNKKPTSAASISHDFMILK